MLRKLLLMTCLMPLLQVARCRADADWQTVAPDNSRFSVSMPGTPQATTAKDAGNVTYTWTLVAEPLVYSANYSDVAGDKDANAVLDAACEGAASDGTKLSFKRPITVQGQPGRAYKLEFKDGTAARAKSVVVGNRLYFFIVAGAPEDIASKNADEFLDSLKLTLPEQDAAPADGK